MDREISATSLHGLDFLPDSPSVPDSMIVANAFECYFCLVRHDRDKLTHA